MDSGRRIRVLGAGLLVAIVLGACGGTPDESRNMAIPGGDFVGADSEDSPYTLESGPGPLSIPLQNQVLAQSFRSHSSPTSLSGVSVGITNSVGGLSSSGSFTLTLHSARDGEPGPVVAVLGTRIVGEFFTGSKFVAPNQLVPLISSTDYFVVMTRASDSESHITWRTVVNSPLTNVSPPPVFVALTSTNDGTRGSWTPLDEGRNHIMRVHVVPSEQDSASTTSVGAVGSTPGSTVTTSGTVAVQASTTTASLDGDSSGDSPSVDSTTSTTGDAAAISQPDTTGASTPIDSEPTGGADAASPSSTMTTTASLTTGVGTGDPSNPAAPPESKATTAPARYSPADDPATTRDIAVTLAAFAAIAFSGGAFARMNGAAGGSGGGVPGGTPSRLSTLATKRLRRRAAGEKAWGDASRSWRWPATPRVDALSSTLPVRWAPRSVIAPRIAVDGAWARAIFGSLGLVPWLVAVTAGVLWVTDADGVVGLPSGWIFAVALAVGILDAAAGTVVYLVVVTGSLATGAVGGPADVRLLMGVGVLLLSGSLVANVVRPLRRIVVDGDAVRERAFDYVMAPVGVMFVLEAMMRMLDGLAERDVTVPTDSVVLRITVAAAVVARLFSEDVAVHAYPDRTRAVQPRYMDGQRPAWGVLGSAVRFGAYLFISEPFFGLGASTIVAAATLTAPFVMEAFGDHLHKSDIVGKWLPRGFLRFFILLVVTTWMSSVMLGDAPSPDTVRSAMPWLFLPSAAVGVVEQFGRTGERWPDTRAKLFGGAALWVVGVLILAGVVTF